jgi:hypothetical protein
VILTTENEKLQHELLLKEQKCQELQTELKESQELKEIALAIVFLALLRLLISPPYFLVNIACGGKEANLGFEERSCSLSR